MIRSGAQMNVPSRIFLSTSDLVSTFSRFQMPRRVCISVWQGTAKSGPCSPEGCASHEAGLPLVEEVPGRLALGGVHGLVPIIAPAVALPGVQRHAVPRRDVPQALHLEHASDVIRGDDAGIARLGGDRQHLGTGRDHALGLLVGDGVQHHAATHEAKLTRMLDAQRTHAHHAAARAVLVGVPGDHALVHHRALRRVDAMWPGPSTCVWMWPISVVTSSSWETSAFLPNGPPVGVPGMLNW